MSFSVVQLRTSCSRASQRRLAQEVAVNESVLRLEKARAAFLEMRQAAEKLDHALGEPR